ncbi:LPO_1073/Vpar_1526 family protein [Nocardia sp. R6R-6]|uniref:LPO_1073/Vpar_1526 family protein n=1 Tax=Nocardia sp. R6R-6 TaxID=3459303 RepID=UPI00403DB9A7
MNWFRQGQSGGDYSRQIQAARDVYITEGVKPDEVVRICTELMRTEFERYSATARKVVEERAQEFLENYMHRQTSVAPDAVSSMERPHMQRALQQAQVEYVSSGDADLGSLLVNLVVELSQKEQRGTHATALQDALKMAPRLTTQQMNALTVVMLGRVFLFHWKNPEEAFSLFCSHFVPFGDLPSAGADFRHIQGVGAAWNGFGGRKTFAENLIDLYPGLFTDGFMLSQLPSHLTGLVLPASENLVKFATPSARQLEGTLKAIGVDAATADDCLALQKVGTFAPESVTDTILKNVPKMGRLMTFWTPWSTFELSTTGVVIADAHLRSRVSGNPPLAI